MGNWRTVQIIGTCAEAEVADLARALDPGLNYENFHPLVCGGVMGLQSWAATTIDALGNLAERDYGPESVAKTLEKLALVAPSLTVKVHCGDDYEQRNCVATVTLQNGKAVIGPAEIETLPEMSGKQIKDGFLNAYLTALKRRDQQREE